MHNKQHVYEHDLVLAYGFMQKIDIAKNPGLLYLSNIFSYGYFESSLTFRLIPLFPSFVYCHVTSNHVLILL